MPEKLYILCNTVQIYFFFIQYLSKIARISVEKTERLTIFYKFILWPYRIMQMRSAKKQRFLLFYYLYFRVYFACYPPESSKIIRLTCIWSKSVDTSLHGHSSQTPQQNHCRISKTWLRYANNRPGTGTSHIIGQNLLAKFGVTQTVNAKFCEFFFRQRSWSS